MKHLENYGVQALSTREMGNINGGGFWGKLILAIGLLVLGGIIARNNRNVQM